MSAAHHLNDKQSGEQLRMFVPAKELRSYGPGDMLSDDGETEQELWDIESEELRYASNHRALKESVAMEGVHNPVGVWHGEHFRNGNHETGKWVIQGHHRTQAAFETDPEQLVPVRHYGGGHVHESRFQVTASGIEDKRLDVARYGTEWWEHNDMEE